MWSVIFTFIGVVLIIYLSYLASKYIGTGLNKSSSSRYMRLVDQITMGQDRHIAIVQVSGKYLLLGITGSQINVLSEIQDEELFPLTPEGEDGGVKAPDFRALLDKLGDMGKKRR
ncbi:MAG: flagellar biosynthetic protein FliO [Ruminococcus sp.]|nr:flagellar biosynthetic protein FliO [Ruminococcus sp.]